MDHAVLATSLRTAVSSLSKRLRKQIYTSDSLSITELTTLSYLDKKGPLYPSELAEVTKVRTQSMSQILKKLQEAGMIKRTASADDKRKVAISLTAAAKKVIEKTRYERDEWLAAAIDSSLSEQEIKKLAAVIPILQKIADAQ